MHHRARYSKFDLSIINGGPFFAFRQNMHLTYVAICALQVFPKKALISSVLSQLVPASGWMDKMKRQSRAWQQPLLKLAQLSQPMALSTMILHILNLEAISMTPTF